MPPETSSSVALTAGEAMAVLGLLSFAVQRLLELFDPLVSSIATNAAARVASEGVDQDAAKKWFMGLASLIVGGMFALVSGVRVLSYINQAHAGFGDYGDLFVTALVLGAGTEGANTALKYFGYVKDAKKLDQPAATALTVLPPEITVGAGESVQLAALSTAGGDVKVRWLLMDVGGGSIDASGVYTAPAGAGTFRLMAVSEKDPTQMGVAVISVV
jgi:hypothetical protein